MRMDLFLFFIPLLDRTNEVVSNRGGEEIPSLCCCTVLSLPVSFSLAQSSCGWILLDSFDARRNLFVSVAAKKTSINVYALCMTQTGLLRWYDTMIGRGEHHLMSTHIAWDNQCSNDRGCYNLPQSKKRHRF